MARKPQIPDVVEEILQSILATQKKQRRLLSSTFWAKFRFKNRTKERIEQVKGELDKHNLIIYLDDSEFGKESKDDWIKLIYILPPGYPRSPSKDTPLTVPVPSDDWFSLMEQRLFESEKEVEYYFVVPLLEQIGYVGDDFAIGYPVQMYEGVKRVNKEADFVIFNGADHSKENVLLIVETKKSDKIISEGAINQARSYAMWLTPPYFLVTNGNDIRVYLFRGAIQPDVMIINFNRSDLRKNWGTFYKTLNKAAVIEYKSKQWVGLVNQPS